MQKNFYIILGVPNNADFEEIKAAYRALAKKYHPDKNHGNKNAEERFKEIQEAYTVLSNPEKRRKYDLKFSHGSAQKTRQTGYTQYTGNAYQYAQQEAQRRQQAEGYEQARTKKAGPPDRSENYYILISVGVAMILLYFIISYSSDTERPVTPASTSRTPTQPSPPPADTIAISDFASPYVTVFGEEIADLESKNSISINNLSGVEAVVCLVEHQGQGRTIRNQYMNAGSSFKMNNIPDGDYFLKIYYGTSWDRNKTFGLSDVKGGFRKDLGFLKVNTGKDAFKMKQMNAGSSVSYSSYDIDLYPQNDSLSIEINAKEFFSK